MQELGVTSLPTDQGRAISVSEHERWYAGTDFDEGRLVFSDFLNLFVFNAKENLGAVVKALSSKGLFRAWPSEPDCHQREGSELPRRRRIPYPVVQSGSGPIGDHHL